MDGGNCILDYVQSHRYQWLDEMIESLDRGNWLYKICTFFTRRKWTYGEMYLFLVELNASAIGLEEAKRKALMRIIDIYKYLNNKEPEGIKEILNDGGRL